jgi:GR25 family glycosyltransferase involved in LPS biosynthesis
MENKEFWEKIDKVFYINLDKRKDRNIHCLKQLFSIGTPVNKIERFSAIEHPQGHVGCFQSHIACLKMAIERNYDNVIIIEDDINFTDVQFMKNNLNKIFTHPFDVFFLGVNLIEYEKIDPDFIRVTRSGCFLGYIVQKHYYERLLNTCLEGFELLMKTGNKMIYAIDGHCMRVLQPIDQWLTFSKLTVSQVQSYSDIENRVVNYDNYMLKDIEKIK